MKEGYGIQEDADGIRSEGEYHMDKRNGEFIEKDKNGTIIKRVTYLNDIPKITSEEN